jgi:hypothetical protein
MGSCGAPAYRLGSFIAMDFDTFMTSLTQPAPPAGCSPILKALWHCKRDEWEAAHDIAQEIPSPMGSRVHGLLHLIEGDVANAAYWYARANLPAVRDTSQIDAEWTKCVKAALA